MGAPSYGGPTPANTTFLLPHVCAIFGTDVWHSTFGHRLTSICKQIINYPKMGLDQGHVTLLPSGHIMLRFVVLLFMLHYRHSNLWLCCRFNTLRFWSKVVNNGTYIVLQSLQVL